MTTTTSSRPAVLARLRDVRLDTRLDTIAAEMYAAAGAGLCLNGPFPQQSQLFKSASVVDLGAAVGTTGAHIPPMGSPRGAPV